MKPSEQEEEYMARQEFEKKKRLKLQAERALEEGEKARLQELHFMKCPKCGQDLIEVDFHKIKVDKCSGCDGIWLDAGEFDQVSRLEKGVLDGLFKVFRR
jgi:hypothetical protein